MLGVRGLDTHSHLNTRLALLQPHIIWIDWHRRCSLLGAQEVGPIPRIGRLGSARAVITRRHSLPSSDSGCELFSVCLHHLLVFEELRGKSPFPIECLNIGVLVLALWSRCYSTTFPSKRLTCDGFIISIAGCNMLHTLDFIIKIIILFK